MNQELNIIQMKTYALCPISDKKINKQEARINAIFSLLLLIVFIYSRNIIPVAFLFIDFLIRGSGSSTGSLITLSSRNILKWLPVKENFINSGPKIFAARIGLVLSALIIISFFSSLTYLSFYIAAILGIFSFMEGLFGLCIACKLYPLIYRLLYTKTFIN